MCDAQMMPSIMGGSPGTVDKQVAAGGDDGTRYSASSFDATISTWPCGVYSNAPYNGFARWTGVTISDTIDVSYISVYADYATGSAELDVYGVDEDNPAAPTDVTEFDADPLTTAVVEWDGAWTTSAWNNSPSLNTIFQELVNSYTISNDAVMVQVKDTIGAGQGNQYNRAYAYEQDDNTWGPKVHIEYSAAAAGVPVQMMHYMRMRRE